MEQWEKMEQDRSQWRKLIHVDIEFFQNSRVQYAAYERLVRKGEKGRATGSQSHHVNCEIRGKLCFSIAGLKSHLRKYV